ncbi:hypothetical protein [Aquabacterium sp.]|uniref:hypothetical protein n=1 Tax=Aquabacterium sp. TaxID=1872578 RepID=UPI003D6C79CD
MWTWLALLFTPLLSLGVLGIAYALVPTSCNHQTVAALHAVYALGCGVSALITALAWPLLPWPKRDLGLPDTGLQAHSRQRFVSLIAGPTGLLFTLVTAAQWLAVWLLSPCLA